MTRWMLGWIFDGSWIDFGWILGGFWKGLGLIFRWFFALFSKIAILLKSQQNTAWAHEFWRSALKKTCKFRQQKAKKRWEFTIGKKQAKKGLKNLIWERLGFRLGRVLGGFWRLLGCFEGSFFHACIWSGLQKCSWRHPGWILARFWKVWEGFWEVLGGFGEGF